VRDAAQKEQRRDVLPADANAEVQARFSAVAGLERSNDLAAGDRIARRERRRDRLVARDHAARMRNRQHICARDGPREVDDAIRRRIDGARRRDVDPTMAGRIRGGRGDERAQDLVRARHWPRPPGLGRSRRPSRCFSRAERDQQRERQGESKHPFIVA
jgi:hypothetical protein